MSKRIRIYTILLLIISFFCLSKGLRHKHWHALKDLQKQWLLHFYDPPKIPTQAILFRYNIKDQRIYFPLKHYVSNVSLSGNISMKICNQKTLVKLHSIHTYYNTLKLYSCNSSYDQYIYQSFNINHILYDCDCNSNIRSSLALFDQAPCNSKWKVGANLLTCHLWSVHDSKFILLISIFRKNNITMFRWMNIYIIFVIEKGLVK